MIDPATRNLLTLMTTVVDSVLLPHGVVAENRLVVREHAIVPTRGRTSGPFCTRASPESETLFHFCFFLIALPINQSITQSHSSIVFNSWIRLLHHEKMMVHRSISENDDEAGQFSSD
jgi:hypothetical protein